MASPHPLLLLSSFSLYVILIFQPIVVTLHNSCNTRSFHAVCLRCSCVRTDKNRPARVFTLDYPQKQLTTSQPYSQITQMTSWIVEFILLRGAHTRAHIYSYFITTKHRAHSSLPSPLIFWISSGEAHLLQNSQESRRSSGDRITVVFDGVAMATQGEPFHIPPSLFFP